MQNNFIFSKKSPVKAGSYIQGDFKKIISDRYRINNAGGNSSAKKEKAIVRDISQTSGSKHNIKEKLSYTIKEGDDRRLSKNGVLRVYNIQEAIDIPVRELLGNWEKTHVGITLITVNGKWCVDGEIVQHKPKSAGSVALKLLVKFATA